ncbi:MAG: 4'-phosphopantetheinyl transferase superfamily protein [Nitrospirota bacterium]|nr:4'-phosphopantetheinyl transferase superfamily protein [Nitrospirota bacterium]
MAISTHWHCPPKDFRFTLEPGDVHIWRAPLSESSAYASRFRPYLSDQEIIRSNRYRIPHPQYQFVITRGILRTLLSHYISVPTSELLFENQAHGKPMLVTPSAHPIQFNVSHTRGMALIAITLQHAVGIDVERIDRTVHDRDIAERYFSKRESTYLMSLSPPERTQYFFAFWTCKEAYLKMEGRGIAGGFAHCEILLETDRPEAGLSLLNQQAETDPCLLYRITAGSAYVGALAVAGSSAKISHWDWQDHYLV